MVENQPHSDYENDPFGQRQDLHMKEKHYSFNQKLNNFPSWMLEIILTKHLFHLCSNPISYFISIEPEFSSGYNSKENLFMMCILKTLVSTI